MISRDHQVNSYTEASPKTSWESIMLLKIPDQPGLLKDEEGVFMMEWTTEMSLKLNKSGMDSVESHNFHLNHDYSKNSNISRSSLADNNMSIDHQDDAMENINENYEDQYRKILTESKRQRKEPLNHPRKMQSYESNANNSAKTVQDYLQKTRKRAEKYVPLRGGHVNPHPLNSTLPVTTHTSKYDPYSPSEIPPKPTQQFLHKFQKFQNTQKVSKTPAKGSEPLCQKPKGGLGKPTSPLGYHENEVERRVVQNRRNLLRDLKEQGISEGQRQITVGVGIECRNDMKIGGRQGQLRTVENVRQNTELNSRRISLNKNFNNPQRMEDVRNTSSERMNRTIDQNSQPYSEYPQLVNIPKKSKIERPTYSRIYKFKPQDISSRRFCSGKKLAGQANFVSAYRQIEDDHVIRNMDLRPSLQPIQKSKK